MISFKHSWSKQIGGLPLLIVYRLPRNIKSFWAAFEQIQSVIGSLAGSEALTDIYYYKQTYF